MSDPHPPVVMEARDLCFEVDGRALVSGLNFSIFDGEVVALLGPNGAGKSTLLKLLAGQIPPTRGRVLFCDRLLAEWSPREMARQRAVLPQSSSVPFEFTAREIVLLGRSPHGDAASWESRALEVMKKSECAHLADRLVTTLSGGEMQRVQLARVLLQLEPLGKKDPKCLLLDEPISNLDPAHQHGTLLLAKQCAREGAGVLVILHDLNLAAHYADRVMLMQNGVLVASGSPGQVLTEACVNEVFEVRSRVMKSPVSEAPAVFVLGPAGSRA